MTTYTERLAALRERRDRLRERRLEVQLLERVVLEMRMKLQHEEAQLDVEDESLLSACFNLEDKSTRVMLEKAGLLKQEEPQMPKAPPPKEWDDDYDFPMGGCR